MGAVFAGGQGRVGLRYSTLLYRTCASFANLTATTAHVRIGSRVETASFPCDDEVEMKVAEEGRLGAVVTV